MEHKTETIPLNLSQRPPESSLHRISDVPHALSSLSYPCVLAAPTRDWRGFDLDVACYAILVR